MLRLTPPPALPRLLTAAISLYQYIPACAPPAIPNASSRNAVTACHTYRHSAPFLSYTAITPRLRVFMLALRLSFLYNRVHLFRNRSFCLCCRFRFLLVCLLCHGSFPAL